MPRFWTFETFDFFGEEIDLRVIEARTLARGAGHELGGVRVAGDGLVAPHRSEQVVGPLELVDAGDEVRLRLLEVCLLLVAKGRGLLPGGFVFGHVRLELGHFLRELRVLRPQIFQLRLSSFDRGRGLFDCFGLLRGRGIAIALELRVHSPIVGPVLLALVEHLLQQLHHFRDGRILFRRKSRRGNRKEEER